MTPEQRDGYEKRLLRERPKYVPMKPEVVARLKIKKNTRNLYKKYLNAMVLEAGLLTL